MYLLLLSLLLLLLTAAAGFLNGNHKPQLDTPVFRTQHFVLPYDNNAPREKIQTFAKNLETSYERLVVKAGFRNEHNQITLKGSFSEEPDYLQCAAPHEFFHIIQSQYPLRLADRFFIEGTAMWAMQEVFPVCGERSTETYEDWLIGGTDYSRLKLLPEGYQGGLFWNFLAERYGGAQLIRKLFEHPDIRQGIDWPKVLGSLTGKPFLDLWIEFAVALATHKIPGAVQLYPLAESLTRYVPVPVYVGEWTGQSFTVNQSNWENRFSEICRKKTDKVSICPFAPEIAALGSSLIVRHPYGIHFLRIVPKSNEPFIPRFEGASDTDFRVHLVVLNNSGVYESFPLAQTCIVSEPMAYKLLQAVITRGEKGSGSYKLIMDNAQKNQYPQCFSERK